MMTLMGWLRGGNQFWRLWTVYTACAVAGAFAFGAAEPLREVQTALRDRLSRALLVDAAPPFALSAAEEPAFASDNCGGRPSRPWHDAFCLAAGRGASRRGLAAACSRALKRRPRPGGPLSAAPKLLL